LQKKENSPRKIINEIYKNTKIEAEIEAIKKSSRILLKKDKYLEFKKELD
jgi:hypothetical protein